MTKSPCRCFLVGWVVSASLGLAAGCGKQPAPPDSAKAAPQEDTIETENARLQGVWRVMTVNGQRRAAFSDERGNTFTGKEGDVLEGRYRLLRIGPDSVDLAYLDGRGRRPIPLTGQ